MARENGSAEAQNKKEQLQIGSPAIWMQMHKKPY